ncbi:cyanate transporter [Pseudomonas sp. MBLB4123]|uniref:cyanate transporter n=1 Tax=Pseudomonas sp. MBLB4123 TaxID=3451557 RepID=UPI003F753696
MHPLHPPVGRARLWLSACVILIGLNLRPSMAAVGPLLAELRGELGISFASAALLTLLPVMSIGLAMFVGLDIARRFGVRRSIGLALLLLGSASLARLFSVGVLDLLLSACAAGLGIAQIQALLPALLKARYGQQVALPMGLYVTAIMAGAALAAGLAPSVAEFGSGWRAGLGIWALLAALALPLWLSLPSGLTRLGDASRNADEPRLRFSRYPRAWLLALFFGLGTAGYTCVLAWLAPYFIELGWHSQRAGLLLAFLTGMEVLSGLLSPWLASRSNDRRAVLGGLLSLICGGLLGLVLAPLAAPWLWATLLGLGIGGLFPLSLILCLDHLDDPHQAGGLTAWVQGIGYLIAGLSPWLAGLLRDALGSFSAAWLALAGIMLLLLLASWRFAPRDYARHFRNDGGQTVPAG